MARLAHLIYTSAATRELGKEELRELLRQSRLANEKTQLTGMLLYSGGSFFQVLEGDSEEIEKLYEKLTHDGRHAQLTVIVKEPIARRSFATWSMGFSEASAQELATIPGLNDFFQAGSCLRELDPGRAKKLLAAFRKGRWRAKLLAADEDPG